MWSDIPQARPPPLSRKTSSEATVDAWNPTVDVALSQVSSLVYDECIRHKFGLQKPSTAIFLRRHHERRYGRPGNRSEVGILVNVECQYTLRLRRSTYTVPVALVHDAVETFLADLMAQPLRSCLFRCELWVRRTGRTRQRRIALFSEEKISDLSCRTESSLV